MAKRSLTDLLPVKWPILMHGFDGVGRGAGIEEACSGRVSPI
jgi:hypothetical protein